jgi:hypothetical protein
MKFLLLLITVHFTFAIISASTSGDVDKIKIKGKWFVDSKDRVVLFRGINAVAKDSPWIPNNPKNNLQNTTHIQNLKEWGFNIVRLGKKETKTK